MTTFKEFIHCQNEGLFGTKVQTAPQQLPSILSYHIADAINKAMQQHGSMPDHQPHRPFGDSPGDTTYNPTLKIRLKNVLYGKARQMLATGDTQGVQKYFGFDVQNERPSGSGTFLYDIQAILQRAT